MHAAIIRPLQLHDTWRRVKTLELMIRSIMTSITMIYNIIHGIDNSTLGFPTSNDSHPKLTLTGVFLVMESDPWMEYYVASLASVENPAKSSGLDPCLLMTCSGEMGSHY